ncbi:MFS transporter [Nocardia iowensis]|uniref:MFS transporter n=1 Tax=Nocardia iowensis TaxID=204891 RepID=A0ABX8S0W9_NOCIO|nr:MFS transporter [Nocardia iowensis]QXN94714.1 MFS transporter [Nocardia iowensis]
MHFFPAPVPTAGPQRTLMLVVLAISVSSGIFMASGALYFNRIIGIPATAVGLGLSLAGAVGIGTSVFAGRLSDQYGPKVVLVANLLAAAGATLGFLAVQNFLIYVAVVVVSATGRSASMVVVGPIINRIVCEKVAQCRAYAKSVFNFGAAGGAGLSAVAVQMDSPASYRVLIVISSMCLLGAAAMVRKLPHLAPAVRAGSRAERWIALKDRPYLALMGLDAVLSLQFRILNVIIPLWIIEHTFAPRWTAPGTLVLNTVIVVTCQVMFSRSIDNPRSGGVALRRSGWAFLAACVIFGFSAGGSGWIAILVLAAGVVTLSVGELWQTAGRFEVSNSLAPPHVIGQYLGVFSVGMRLSDSIGPALLTVLCLEVGRVGWLAVGLALLGAGLIAPAAVRRAESTRTRRDVTTRP